MPTRVVGLAGLAAIWFLGACATPNDLVLEQQDLVPPTVSFDLVPSPPQNCQPISSTVAGHYGKMGAGTGGHLELWSFKFLPPAAESCQDGIPTGTNYLNLYYTTGLDHQALLWRYSKATGAIVVDPTPLADLPPAADAMVPVSFVMSSEWGAYAIVISTPGGGDVDAFLEITNNDLVQNLVATRTGRTKVTLTWLDDGDVATTLDVRRDGVGIGAVDPDGTYDDMGVTQATHTYTFIRVRELSEAVSNNMSPFDVPANRMREGPSDFVTINLPWLDPPSITSPGTLPSAPANEAYTYQLAASGGFGSYSWALAPGHPSWLSVSPTGALTGTPPSTGTFSFTAQVTATDETATKQLTLTIGTGSSLTITSPDTLPAGTFGQNYSYMLQAAGGTGPYAWTQAGGTLPADIMILGAGAMNGAPWSTGTFTFTAQVTSGGQAATKQLVLTVNPAPPGPLTAAITGPTSIGSLDVCQWNAVVSGAQTPISYEWKKNFTVVGSDSYWIGGGTATFILKLKVTETGPGGRIVNTSVKVNVYQSGVVNPC